MNGSSSDTQHVFEGALSQAYWRRRSGSAGKRCAMRAFRATGESVEGNYRVRPRESESWVGDIGGIHSLFTFGFGDALLLLARAYGTQAPNFHSPLALTSPADDASGRSRFTIACWSSAASCWLLLVFRSVMSIRYIDVRTTVLQGIYMRCNIY